MDFINRLISYLTGYHIYSGPRWVDPDCILCGQKAYGENKCTGWPKRERKTARTSINK